MLDAARDPKGTFGAVPLASPLPLGARPIFAKEHHPAT